MDNKYLDMIAGNIPSHIIAVVEKIENKGFSAYVVGGAIRDLLLERVPFEFDLATNARPDDIINLFDNVNSVGKAFGTIQVHFDGAIVDVTTFRQDGEYSDFRHPNQVRFTNQIDADLARRDFTINAMAYQPIRHEFVDQFNGFQHLKERRLEVIGSPMKRFQEDTLRPFRCFRFMSQLGFIVSSDILSSLKKLSNSVELPSMPRIKHEMGRLLLGNYWLSALNLMHQSEWLSKIIPDYPIHETIDLPHEALYRWAWLFSKCSLDEIAAKFQFSKTDISSMKEIIEWNYNESAINFTIDQLNISSEQLIALGFKGKDLGNIQRTLQHLIREEKLLNYTRNIIDYLETHRH